MDTRYILLGIVVITVSMSGCTLLGKESEQTTTVIPTTLEPTTSIVTIVAPTTIPTTVEVTTVPTEIGSCNDLCITQEFSSGECKRTKSECRTKGGTTKEPGNKYCAGTRRECCCL